MSPAGWCNAVVDRMYDQAKAAIAVRLPSGPFSGVPYLLKDIGPLYAGTVTTLGSSCRIALNCKKIHSEGKKLPLTARITAFRCH